VRSTAYQLGQRVDIIDAGRCGRCVGIVFRLPDVTLYEIEYWDDRERYSVLCRADEIRATREACRTWLVP